jgi:hypothetical protein
MGKILTGSHVVCMEGIGALVASSGAIVCASSEHNDNVDKDDSDDKAEALMGDFYALASAFCGVGYLIFAKSARFHQCHYVYIPYDVWWFLSDSLLHNFGRGAIYMVNESNSWPLWLDGIKCRQAWGGAVDCAGL